MSLAGLLHIIWQNKSNDENKLLYNGGIDCLRIGFGFREMDSRRLYALRSGA